MKEKKYLSIGRVSAITGISIKALRFYEKENLLVPEYTDPSSRYRYYSPRQILSGDIIKGARLLGMSIPQIRKILSAKNMDRLDSFLDDSISRTEKLIQELNTKRISTGLMKAAFLRASEAINKSGIYYREYPERYMIARDFRGRPDQARITRMHYYLLSRMIPQGLINAYDYGVILKPDKKGHYRPSRLYACVQPFSGIDLPVIETLPAGSYACACIPVASPSVMTERFGSFMESNDEKPPFIVQANLMVDIFRQSEYVELQVLVQSIRHK